MDQQALRQLWGKLVAESWGNPKLRARLLAEPAAVLKEYNAGIPDGIKVRALEDDGQTLYLPLPLQPPAGELGENDLDAVAGGTAVTTHGINATIAVRPLGKLGPIAETVLGNLTNI